MILLCLANNSSEAYSKKRIRTYEVNENFPVDYPSQKSIFHLHFWFKKTLAKGFDSSNLDSFDPTASIMEEKAKNVFTKPIIKKIIQEALSTLHYLVEIRHKFLSKNV